MDSFSDKHDWFTSQILVMKHKQNKQAGTLYIGWESLSSPLPVSVTKATRLFMRRQKWRA